MSRQAIQNSAMALTMMHSGKIQYSQKGKYSHDHIHGKIPDQTFVVVAHIPAAQERQRGKWSDHGVFHAEKEICNKKYQGGNNGRSDSALHAFFSVYLIISKNHL